MLAFGLVCYGVIVVCCGIATRFTVCFVWLFMCLLTFALLFVVFCVFIVYLLLFRFGCVFVGFVGFDCFCLLGSLMLLLPLYFMLDTLVSVDFGCWCMYVVDC